MALNGKLLLNGADYSPLNLYGVGVFMAFSGNGIYRNKGACGAMKGDGPCRRVNTGLWNVVLEDSFHRENLKYRMHGIRYVMVLHLGVMNGLPCTGTTGGLMTVHGLMAFIGGCSGCIRELHLRVV